MTGHYRDFLGVIDDALVFACKSLAIELTGVKRTALIESYLKMPIWPDVLPALSMLKESGLRLALLSNFSPAMFDGNLGGTELEGTFEFQLSTDAVRAYKPDPRAYQMGVDAFGLKREEILFAAFAGWTPPAQSCSAIPPSGSTGRSSRASSWRLFQTMRGRA